MSVFVKATGRSVHDGAAVLVREVQVRLLNASASGCLIESNRQLTAGTAALLRIDIDGEEYVDEVQIVRCQAIAGAGSTYHVGVKFLWTAMPHSRSIRYALAGRSELLAMPLTTRVM